MTLRSVRDYVDAVVRRAARRARRETADLRPLSDAERAFITANAAYWERHFRSGAGRSRGYVLVEPIYHPLMLLETAHLGAMIALERDLDILFMLPNPLARALEKTLRSYPRAQVEYVFDMRADAVRLVGALVDAMRVYRKLRSPDDVLELTIDGVVVGDLVYDTVLQQGYATVDQVDRRTLRELWRFFYYRRKTLHLLSRYRIAAGAFAGRHSVVAGTIFRYLTQQHVEVVLRSGPRLFAAAKYSDLRDAKTFEFRPEQKYVDAMRRSEASILPAAEAYLKRRLSHEIQPTASTLSFDTRKRVYTSKREFCESYGLDPARPLVFVMLHAFNDHPHMLGPLLFRDYFTWFEATLAVADQTPAVNWVFKEHPAAEFYPTKDFDSRSLARRLEGKSILYLDANADFNGKSLPHLARAIVTCIGTAGLEYSALGVPCLLGGTSPYSGFGFTFEPRSSHAYLQALRAIDTLPALTREQVSMAKLIAYFYLHVVLTPVDPFFRDYDFREIHHVTFQTVWQDAARILARKDPYLDDHLSRVRNFLRREDFTQYVDLAAFPFLATAFD